MSKFSAMIFEKVIIAFFLTCTIIVAASDCLAQVPLQFGQKVLVVMSYHQGYQGGEKEIKNVLDELLEGAEIKYFYLDTKNNPQEGPQKAIKAYEFFQQFKPDAVIAANDNAQSLFVVPFLKDKTEVPVIFCGVNDDATKYGYPASNVSGVIEKKHYKESFELLTLIDSSIKNVAVVYKDNPTNEKNLATIRKDLIGSPLTVSVWRDIRSIDELQDLIDYLDDKVDALVLLNMTGITDSQGVAIEAKDAVAYISRKWRKPTVAAGSWEIEAGALCGVIQVDKDQGFAAAQMLFDLWAGKKISELRIIDTSLGQWMINLSTAKHLGLKIKPGLLLSVKTIY